jgi:hypothetical protein
MRRAILSLMIAGSLIMATAAPAAAQTTCNLPAAPQRGGAAGLVALVQAVVNANVGVAACDIDVNILNRSLNNLLRDANIRALNNILNNSPILSNDAIDVTVTEVLNGVQINVLSSGLNITITDPLGA